MIECNVICEKCGTLMWRAPVVLTSDPPQYEYHCPKCDHTQYSRICDHEHVVQSQTQWKKLQQEEKEQQPMEKDMVNHPAHYTAGGIECIDALAAATAGLEGIEAVCTANAIKYLWRWKLKNGAEDLKKAQWYINHLIEHLDKKD